MRSHVTVAEVLALSETDPLIPVLLASENALAAALRLLADMPAARLIEDGRGFRFFNREMPPESMIFGTRWEREDAEAMLDAELARFESIGLDIDWFLFGPPSPPDLADRLVRRGLKARRNLWLIADLTALPPAPPNPPGLRIVPVDSEAQWNAWQTVFARGFNSEIGAQRYREAYVERPRDFGSHQRAHHVGYVGDVPVVCSTLLMGEGVVTLWDIATDPAHRRRGYGAAIVRRLLGAGIAMGCRVGSLNSSPLGRSMYMAVGFEREVEVPEFHWSPPAKTVGTTE